MATIKNEITINAPIEKIWSIMSDVSMLEKYDPTVKRSLLISPQKTGIGAKRKVEMLDGKNWFEETTTVFKENEALEFQLTACSFPIKSLEHTYSFRIAGPQITVFQVMKYQVKFGPLGKLMDALMIRKQSDAGIKKFFAGLKEYSEKR